MDAYQCGASAPTNQRGRPGKGELAPEKLDGYVFEGHITSEIIKRFLAEKPKDLVGLSLPGMPSGVPGMEGEGTGSHKVYAINKDGTTATYATQ